LWSWGTCNNLHHVVFGQFNPESGRQAALTSTPEIIAALDAAFAAAAALEETMPTPRPTEWFQDPGLPGPTPLTITADGRVFGHLATWDTCHVGITGECVTPPRSNHNYAYFRTGEVVTASGDKVPVGQITMNTGHADRNLAAASTVAHYDNTGTAVVDVAAGEDTHGIWVAGAMRDGVSEDQVYVLQATGAISGDWRKIGGNLELVAALVVNVPGFPVPRMQLAASAVDETPISLVAAAIVVPDPNAVIAERVEIAVNNALDKREERRVRTERVNAILASARDVRAEALRRVAASIE
jgi:hypothetical protein